MSEATSRSRCSVVIADLVESVRLMTRDEFSVIARWRAFVAEVQGEVLPRRGGRLVKSLGDGLLLEFAGEIAALEASHDLLVCISRRNDGFPDDMQLQLRIGVHSTEVVRDDLDVYGSGVNLCARLAGLAAPGQVVVSAEVRAAVAAREAAPHVAGFDDLGWCYLKHIEHPVQAFRARFDPPAAAVGAVKAAPAAPTASATPVLPSIAVLTFGADAPHVSPVVGPLLADALQARLAVCPLLHVVSRWSSRAVVPAGEEGLAEAGRALGADYVVCGTVRALGERHVASVELVEVADSRIAWAGRCAFRAEDLLEADDAPSIELAAAISMRIVESHLRRSMTAALPTLDSNALLLSASALMHQAGLEAFQRAHAMLEHLVERHPRRPSPRAWAAMWHVLQVTRGFVHDPQQVAGRALDHVHRALDNDPECALALAMQGFVHCHLRRDLPAAEEALSLSVALNPSEPWGWLFRSVVAAHHGDGERAWAWASKASTLSPLDPQRHYYDGLRSNAALVAERWEDAIRLAERSLSINGDHLPTLRGLAIAQVSLDRVDDARATGRRIVAVDPAFNLADYLAAAPPDGRSVRARYAELLAMAGLPSH